MINHLRIKNLRSITDTGRIEVKKINILVGQNSSGKSTFARFFPLIRQSTEERTKGPVLWYGRLVDFGNFSDAIRHGSQSEMEFTFGITLPKFYAVSDIETKINKLLGKEDEEEFKFDVTIYLKESSDKGTYASRLKVETLGIVTNIEYKDQYQVNSISVGGIKLNLIENLRAIVDKGDLIPIPKIITRITRKSNDGENKIWVTDWNTFKQTLSSEIAKHVHGNTSNSKIGSIASGLKIGSKNEVWSSAKGITGAPESWTHKMQELDPEGAEITRLRDAMIMSSLPELLERIDVKLSEFFNGVKYIEPLRATAQRYYRRQELAVDEIDSKGANVAMYLDSLTQTDKAQLEAWMVKHVGFSIIASNVGGHIYLQFKDPDGIVSDNIADMGFGTSQLLPILVQLWAVSKKKDRQISKKLKNKITSVIIEQPELHLHPQLQAKVADLLMAASSSDVPLFVETHSEHIINKLGRLICNGMLSSDDVQILLFEKDGNETSVKSSTFDSSGVLIDWPYGFFDPDYN